MKTAINKDPKKVKKYRKLSDNDNTWYIFLIPVLLGLIFFTIYPIIESFRLSFFKSNGITEEFVGLKNYNYIFSNELFWKATWNTFYITFFQLIISLPIAYVIACLINEIKIGKNILKSLFFIPYVTPVVASATVFLFVLHPDGILNNFLVLLGFDPVNWLLNPISAQWGTIIFSSWQAMGFYIIIFLANLQTISEEYAKAGQVDGANKFQIWWHITTPLMKNTFIFLIVMGWISGLQRFSDVYVIGGPQGSPARALHTIVGFIYERGFGSFEFGVASAAAYVLFTMIAIFTAVNMFLGKTKKES
ncbi:sugar ABC transporter permease [Candidatus Epulonipiscium fishelsonii]|uniref:Sugar ABC transporter permease n=1 Tax=Candidatus Epulonipiscium fishelsonii TaxID=77094 RepID=A0ACC8X8K7_9FIRM|nr:sugar ABC transporter permease [Epulopiscium sp. SCG-B11WGA-EpuloA1]ONI38406.1 sugar ABC transporter permease [Epulopiscium sp. SCG-B05WGA-EpuloA1]